MSSLTKSLIKRAFVAGSAGMFNIRVNKNEIIQLCESYFSLVRMDYDYRELQDRINNLYNTLVSNQEYFDEIEEACDWEGHASTIIEQSKVRELPNNKMHFDIISEVQKLAEKSEIEFDIDIRLLMSACQTYQEVEHKQFDNLKSVLSLYETTAQLHYDTFVKIKNEVDYSEVKYIVTNHIKHLDSK